MEGSEWDDMMPKPWLCPRPNLGLSMCIQHHDYDGFIKEFGWQLKQRGKIDIEDITIKCEGQCPKGCNKKFKLKLGKSITEKSFEKIFKHGIHYPNHCLVVKYNGVIKHGDIL